MHNSWKLCGFHFTERLLSLWSADVEPYQYVVESVPISDYGRCPPRLYDQPALLARIPIWLGIDRLVAPNFRHLGGFQSKSYLPSSVPRWCGPYGLCEWRTEQANPNQWHVNSTLADQLALYVTIQPTSISTSFPRTTTAFLMPFQSLKMWPSIGTIANAEAEPGVQCITVTRKTRARAVGLLEIPWRNARTSNIAFDFLDPTKTYLRNNICRCV